jgi:2-hydroxy-6-oxonona-2,4-dienedioate hydrolase
MKSIVISYPLSAAGIQTRVIEVGTGDKCVVFIHGVGARADRWKRNWTSFVQAGYHCYAIDLPGHGFAEKHDGLRFDMSTMVGFLRAVFDALGIHKATLVGTSYGGLMAAHFALKFPLATNALILIGSLGLAPIAAPARARMADSLKTVTKDGIRSKLERMLFDKQLITEQWIEEEWRINTSPGAAEALSNLASYVASDDGLNAELVADVFPDLASRIPTMLVWGAEDKSVPPAVGLAARSTASAAGWLAIDHAGHVPYFEESEIFNIGVADFLATRLPGSSHAANKEIS